MNVMCMDVCICVCVCVWVCVRVFWEQVQKDYCCGQVKKLKDKLKEYCSRNDPMLTPEHLQNVMDELSDIISKLKIELITIQDDWNNRCGCIKFSY